MKRRLLTGGLLAALMAVLGLHAGCDQLQVLYLNSHETTVFEPSGSDFVVSGTLNQHSLEGFQDVLKAHPEITRLVLLDMPGSVDDETNLRLGHLVRDLGLDTHLTAQSDVQSGGTDLFLAGQERSMEAGALIGVHSWADGNTEGRDIPRSDPVHRAYVAYTKRMLGRADFYWFTLEAAPADDMHHLTAQEISTYGLLTQPVITQ